MDAHSSVKAENANYEKVMYYIDKMLAESNSYCRCNRCRMEAACIALNTMPPHYYVAPGNMRDKELGAPWILIEVAVRYAMEQVLTLTDRIHDGESDVHPDSPFPHGYSSLSDKTGTDG